MVREPLANIIVRNIPKQIVQSEIFKVFSEFGSIKSCKLNCELNGESRGFAYI